MYEGFSREQLLRRRLDIEKKYNGFKELNLKLDMSRGKPSDEQLSLSNGIFDNVSDLTAEGGIDCRNYGVVDGLIEMKRLFAEILGVSPDEVIAGDGSSLKMMYDAIARSFNHGIMGNTPWSKLKKVKFLCPSPGYDRHFFICELFKIEMITIPMNDDGPDMDVVEAIAGEDESVKGIWCTPMYSNPTGVIYSDEVVKRFAKMKTKAEDFRIFWDNAYVVHHLYEENKLLNILDECKKAGNPDRVFMFTSTSKISFAGAGVAAMAASRGNMEYIKKQLAAQTIGPNKINQLLHVRFFKDLNGIKAHMKKHAELLRPKFEAVLDILDRNLGNLNIASWTRPKGGYFISFNTQKGCAKELVARAREAGVSFTAAGATYPYGIDPDDKNIRIAPSYPPLAELKMAMEIFCTCVELVTLRKIL
ncbi:MAG: aminotransferase class I/II-fold pyridoxal phosphate-dependent enzyme [Clostridiaceae bacterium]|jgi:DNA-binding transcriptional MocR family regulator|nr:aminotransferase class I/II-fold pyridoxal phosphate-dependent enzyme [Clostridiaceae bacterium]